jgi:glycosyltransferase involved in cell wall biosynthesis
MQAHTIASSTGPAVQSRIAVDLTLLHPGGTNGGAKIVSLELVSALSEAAPSWEFILLTGASTHDEIAPLDSVNVRRICVRSDREISPPSRETPAPALDSNIGSLLPPRGRRWLGHARRLFQRRVLERRLLLRLGARALLCPLTAPTYADPAVPTVSIVYDLQHVQHPEFFTSEQRYLRTRDFEDACAQSARLVCISEFVRQTVIETRRAPASRVVTIYPRLFDRLARAPATRRTSALAWMGDTPFMLYPANFWLHKNHAMLFEAFRRHHASVEGSNLRLVCTGAPGSEQEAAQRIAAGLGLEGLVMFPGYLSDQEFTSVLRSAQALVFPSLYEGFGMPILEAMSCGVPVLCSNLTSLPEIAEGAALLFDPRSADEIAAAITRITTDKELVADLVARGTRRVGEFGDRTRMAHEYLEVLSDTIQHRPESAAT